MSATLPRTIFDREHEDFRTSVRTFVEREVMPYADQWERDGAIPRSFWLAAGQSGLLGVTAPEELGGGGVDDPRFHLIIQEELARTGHASVAVAVSLQNEVVLPYLLVLGTDEQRARWVPDITAGRSVLAVAITEPGTGSDMSAISTTYRRTADGYRLTGAKTFISNGASADLVVVAARDGDNPETSGFSLLVVEAGMDGFLRGRKLEKLGLHAQDTSELTFDDVEVPADHLLGEDGRGFTYLKQFLVHERLATAVGAVNHAEQYLAWTVDYCRGRRAFGDSIAAFQNTRFVLAELATEIQIARVFVDRCHELLRAGLLTDSQAAMAKWWCTELRTKVADRGVQLHGGYGFMLEYPIGRAFIDSRVETIYAGTTEIMKEVVARDVIGRL